MIESTDVIITSDLAKLPPSVADLLDPQKRLPPDIKFFEKRFDFPDLAKAIGFSIIFALVSLLTIPFGIYYLIHRDSKTQSNADFLPLIFGLICAFACWIFLASLRTRLAARKIQNSGQQTRFGIFLLPGALLESSEFSYTLVPRSHFVGIKNHAFQYTLKSQTKSSNLPAALVNRDVDQLLAAIERWSKANS